MLVFNYRLLQQPCFYWSVLFAMVLGFSRNDAHCQSIDRLDLFIIPQSVITVTSGTSQIASGLSMLDSTDTVCTKAFIRIQNDSTLDSLFVTLETGSDTLTDFQQGLPELTAGSYTINGSEIDRTDQYYMLNMGMRTYKPPFILHVAAKDTLGNLEPLQTIIHD